MISTLTFLAQGSPQGGGLSSIFMILIMFVMMWVIVIRPQQKQRKELAAKIAAMKVGDKVVTAGGIHGMVHKIKDNVVTLKVAEGVIMEFEKTSMQTVNSKKSESAKS